MFGLVFTNRNRKVNRSITVMAPVSGKIIDLAEVKDEVFAKKIVGDGTAIEPSEGVMAAPFDGKIKQLFPTGHAAVFESKEGLTVLVHIGLDTVNLNGKGFKILVKEGQKVRAGDAIVEFDIDFIKNSGHLLQTPIILPEKDKIASMEITEKRNISKGDPLMKVDLLPN